MPGSKSPYLYIKNISGARFLSTRPGAGRGDGWGGPGQLQGVKGAGLIPVAAVLASAGPESGSALLLRQTASETCPMRPYLDPPGRRPGRGDNSPSPREKAQEGASPREFWGCSGAGRVGEDWEAPGDIRGRVKSTRPVTLSGCTCVKSLTSARSLRKWCEDPALVIWRNDHQTDFSLETTETCPI